MEYVAPLISLRTILLTISSAIGFLVIIYGGMRFAVAFKKLDQNGEYDAIYTIAGGGIWLALSIVVGLLT